MNAESAAGKWKRALTKWDIPAEIQDKAPESPWTWPRSQLKRSPDQIDTPSRDRAVEALAHGGTVLDIGVGAGWGSLPLAPPAARIVGVDPNADMLSSFARTAEARGIRHQEIHDYWPEAAPAAGHADVVVCHHVVFNVPDLAPFATALTARARHRVIVETTTTHPASWLNPLWRHFHGLERPNEPTAADAVAVLHELGLDAHVEFWQRSPWTEAVDRHEAVEFARRFLCLPTDRYPEVDALLPERPGNREFTTIWWSGTGSKPGP